jgi:hypothetical protein
VGGITVGAFLAAAVLSTCAVWTARGTYPCGVGMWSAGGAAGVPMLSPLFLAPELLTGPGTFPCDPGDALTGACALTVPLLVIEGMDGGAAMACLPGADGGAPGMVFTIAGAGRSNTSTADRPRDVWVPGGGAPKRSEPDDAGFPNGSRGPEEKGSPLGGPPKRSPLDDPPKSVSGTA